jgi:hypothetical protein
MMLNFFNSNKKLCVRIMFHLNILLILADILWVVIYSNVWDNQHNSYYFKLASIHTIVKILCLIQICLKIVISIFIYTQFKSLQITNKELLDFTYFIDLDGSKSNKLSNIQK